MRRKLFLALLLAVAMAIPAVAAPPEIAEPEAEAAICYLGVDGFVVVPPEGWVNLPEAAAAFGVCVMYVPAGHGFDDAPAVIYPRVVPLPGKAAGADPVQSLVDDMLEYFAGRPGGQQAEAALGPALVSESGLRFATRYFNRGPDPNNFELVAYHPAESSLLLLVLSARSEPERRAAEAALRQVAEAVIHMRVAGP